MNVVIFCPNRLLAASLRSGLNRRTGIVVIAVVDTFSAVRHTLAKGEIDLVLIDVTQSIDLDEVQKLTVDFSGPRWLALGPEELKSKIIDQESGGFLDFVTRDVSVDELCKAISNPVSRSIMTQPKNPRENASSLPASNGFSLNPFRWKTSGAAKQKS